MSHYNMQSLVKPAAAGAIAGVIDLALISGSQREAVGFGAATAIGVLLSDVITKKIVKDNNTTMGKLESHLLDLTGGSVVALGLNSFIFNSEYSRNDIMAPRLGAVVGSVIAAEYVKASYTTTL